MDFQDLIGGEFTENELYESVLFQVEENFDHYFTKYIHLYFQRVTMKRIRITQVMNFRTEEDLQQRSRQIIEKMEWLEVTRNCNHINLILCRLDRSGQASTVRKDRPSETFDWCHGWADETHCQEPMTPEEIRLAFQELSGLFEHPQSTALLRPKKSV